MIKVKKAVIPAAGLGTRFLPWTKAMPKEMLPIVDKPVIQYVVEECVGSGIEEIIIVTSWHKRAIEDYFDHLPELEWHLERQGKTKELEQIRKVADMAHFVFIRQKGSYGNATPVLCAKRVVGNEPFAVLWGDQFLYAQPPRLKQCLQAFDKYQSPVIAGIRVGDNELKKRGVCKIMPFKKEIYEVKGLVEKPGPEKAPSNLAAYGSYILTPDIFPILEELKPGKGGEIWLVDAISRLCQKRRVLAVELKNGHLYDAGNKLNYHKTVVDFMLQDKEIGKEMFKYLKEKIKLK
ncbi:MAG TPA: UTP--glucose-1-phosphate uridylyltransferase [Candidatus Bathyarchaeia archaeon]|nr:UTP--glucose-1-phosphate uridylyltransferase [Candidatus Bathyarchaeia archaeon]